MVAGLKVSSVPTDHEGDLDDTTADLRDGPSGPKGRALRRLGIGLLGLVLVLAALGLLGPRIAQTRAEGGGYSLLLDYPQITRAGQPTPLHISIEADHGLGDTVQVRLCDEFFNDLDFQQWYPNPAAETTVPPWIIYEFDPPPSGNTLEISLDARIAPGQFGETDDCQVSVLVDDKAVVSTEFTVWRMP